jgi:hypothetical protein
MGDRTGGRLGAIESLQRREQATTQRSLTDPPLDDGSLVDFDGFDTRRRSAGRTMETTGTSGGYKTAASDVLPDATAVMDPLAMTD